MKSPYTEYCVPLKQIQVNVNVKKGSIYRKEYETAWVLSPKSIVGILKFYRHCWSSVRKRLRVKYL